MVGNVKAESLLHFTLKCLIYKRLKELGRKANAEFDTEGHGIFDAVDWSSGFVFEVIKGTLSKKQIQSKLRRYLKTSGIRDVIFIYTKDYSMEESLESCYKRVCEKVV